MKTIKLIVVFTLGLMCSCQTDRIGYPPGYTHSLWLGFQNISGNDLLEGAELIWSDEMSSAYNSKFYTLDVVYEDGIPDPYKNNDPRYDKMYPGLFLWEGQSPPWQLGSRLNLNPNYNYLQFNVFSNRNYFAQKIIFRLTCPYLFGDDEAHDIVTWWKNYTYRNKYNINTFCYRMEYEGNEVPVYGNDMSEGFRVANIILNR
ncbi:MAG: hypothetical protein LBV47_08645 [Bacteroidales bacterium]|jgi:hypothetical protein|nr:hypothetical protein [Bacteroidales bacterium]